MIICSNDFTLTSQFKILSPMLRVGLSCKRSAFIPPLLRTCEVIHNQRLAQNATATPTVAVPPKNQPISSTRFRNLTAASPPVLVYAQNIGTIKTICSRR